MANSSLGVSVGTDALVDTFTESGSGKHRQSCVVTDPSTTAAAAAVKNAIAATSEYGLVVRTVPTALPTHLVSAASTNATSIKASAGVVWRVLVYNAAAYAVYVKFHNTASTPTAGSGVVLTIGIESGNSPSLVEIGARFSTGIGMTIVKDIADNGTTAVAAADCVVDVFWE